MGRTIKVEYTENKARRERPLESQRNGALKLILVVRISYPLQDTKSQGFLIRKVRLYPKPGIR